MATQAQVNANRENAKKSTGPRTAQGKRRSSRNSLKHGLLARDAVMVGEDPAEFDRLFQEFEEVIYPKNALEFSLVRQVTDAEWRLRRISRLEAGYLTDNYGFTQRHTLEYHPKTLRPGREGKNQLLGKCMQNTVPTLTSLARYHTLMSRNQLRAINLIRRLRIDETECGQNREANGAINRPTVTDPDPYNTPDPLEPQTERYKPPSAVPQPPRDPIGFSAGTDGSTESPAASSAQGSNPQCRGTACRARRPDPAQNVVLPTSFNNKLSFSPPATSTTQTPSTRGNLRRQGQTQSRRSYLESMTYNIHEPLTTHTGTQTANNGSRIRPPAHAPSRSAAEMMRR